MSEFPCKVVKELNDYSAILVTLLNDGTVYAKSKLGWGYKYGLGGLGVLLDVSDIVDIIPTEHIIFFLRKDGNVYSLDVNKHPILTSGKHILENMNIYGVKKIAHCEVYNDSIVFLKENGIVYGYGNNYYGQLGVDRSIRNIDILTEIMSNVKDVACGGCHTVILLNDGTVYHCGYYGYKSLKICDIDVKELSQVKLPDKVKSISCNSHSSIFELENGDRYGYGSTSNLGIETEYDLSTLKPVLLK